MQLKKAERKKVRLKIGMSGFSGAGKTYSSLQLANGLTGDWQKIAVIDTENGSASLYSHLGPYNTIELAAPYSPERYIEAIRACEQAGMEAIIVDSTSHEWDGKGGCLEIHEKLGGRFADWAKLTPRHRAFIEAMLQSPAHILGCMRTKTEYALEQNEKGKATPRKVGMADVQRQGLEYEWSIAFRLNHNHLATCDKDRTGLFMGGPEFVISPDTGRKLVDWANTGAAAPGPGTPAAAAECYQGTDAQKRALFSVFGELGISDPDLMKGYATKLHGTPMPNLHGWLLEELENRPL